MKLSSALILLIGTTFPLAGQNTIIDPDEITILLELIETSKKNLEEQKKLLKLIVDFKKAREAFITEPTSVKLAALLVKSAAEVSNEIEKSQLSYLFPTDFMTEIRFFTQVGEKHASKREKA